MVVGGGVVEGRRKLAIASALGLALVQSRCESEKKHFKQIINILSIDTVE